MDLLSKHQALTQLQRLSRGSRNPEDFPDPEELCRVLGNLKTSRLQLAAPVVKSINDQPPALRAPKEVHDLMVDACVFASASGGAKVLGMLEQHLGHEETQIWLRLKNIASHGKRNYGYEAVRSACRRAIDQGADPEDDPMYQQLHGCSHLVQADLNLMSQLLESGDLGEPVGEAISKVLLNLEQQCPGAISSKGACERLSRAAQAGRRIVCDALALGIEPGRWAVHQADGAAASEWNEWLAHLARADAARVIAQEVINPLPDTRPSPIGLGGC